MATKFKAGDKVYIVESNRVIRECTVVRGGGNLYIIRFQSGGGIQVKGHRLYHSEEEAERRLSETFQKKKTKYRSPYDYLH